LIRVYTHRHFQRKLKLADVSIYTLARFMDWLSDEEEQESASATARSPTP
jgi:hypothetical protein